MWTFESVIKPLAILAIWIASAVQHTLKIGGSRTGNLYSRNKRREI
jgi:hypothetical protein